MRIAQQPHQTHHALAAAAAILGTLVVLAAGGWPPRAEATFPAQPHVVVIMADDLDVHTVETLLALGFLPNLRHYVVDRGVRFRESFISNSLCCPSRSTHQMDSLHLDSTRADERAALNGHLMRLRRCGAEGEPTCRSLER